MSSCVKNLAAVLFQHCFDSKSLLDDLVGIVDARGLGANDIKS